MNLRNLSLLTAVSILAFTGAAQSADYKNSDAYLTGDWNGNRTALLDAGFDVSAVYKADYWSVIDGGIKDGSSFVHNLDFKVDLDGSKLFGLSNNTSRLRAVYAGGNSLNSSRVGSIEGTDNIEMEEDGIRLYEFWTEQRFLDDSLSVLGGVYDLDEDFANTEMSGNFLKPSMGLMPTLAGSGRNGISEYGHTGLAARAKYTYDDLYYGQVAVSDATPGSVSKNNSGTHLGLSDGFLVMSEVGLTPRIQGEEFRTPNKLALGYWFRTEDQADLFTGAKNELNQGVYLLASYEFYADDSNRTMGAFFKTGMSDEDTQQVDFNIQSGVVAKGFIPTREQGEIGLGYTQADNSRDYKRANAGVEESEYSFTTYYRDEVIPGINVQPEFQYVKNPGTDPANENATIFGLRFELNM